ncbi:hypothetical protein ACFOY2_15360 [Nonomuraea purpurea]|uniref:Uncharacterized protein n=1 Tax=Nonomuraea purpurea TaxID=1849276 RepID=A0ABV8G4G4_9ACTN
MTAVIVGVATGLGTSAGQKFLGLGENKPPAPIGPPIKITKVTLVPRDTDQTWVFPDPLSEQALDKINGEYAAFKDHDEILRSSGAVETGVSTVEVEVEGNRAKDVRITDIAVVPRCQTPLRGALFYLPPQGEAETVQIGYDLDRRPLIGQYPKKDETDPYPQLTGNYFADQKYILKLAEQATFRLSAVTRGQYCEYHFDLKYIADGKPDSLLINNNGKDFRVSALIEKDRTLDCSAYGQRYSPGDPGWKSMDTSSCAD